MTKPRIAAQKLPVLHGMGVGLRSCHYAYIENHHPNIAWFEALSDNYLCEGGPGLYHLDSVRASYPVTLHGVGLSLGSTDPLNQDYLNKLKKLVQRIDPPLVSDHLCWISVANQYLHELLPLPYTEEALQHVVQRIQQVQEFLGRRIMIENVSSYLTYNHSTMTEWDFVSAVAEAADCWILLDINNIYVSSVNHGFKVEDYLSAIPAHRVAQFHLAGFENLNKYLFDTHGEAVMPEVWQLYKKALAYFHDVPVLLERDQNIPDFSVLEAELQIAQKILDSHHEIA